MFSLSTVIYFIWFLSEVGINLLLRSKRKDQNRDQKSLLLIWGAVMLAIFLGIFLMGFKTFQISTRLPINSMGLTLIILGIILRFFVIQSLGNLFTAEVSIQENHHLKTDGFYKYVRHPSYSASLLSFLGFGLSLNNYLSLMVVFGLLFAAFSYRIKVEEQALSDYFDVNYLIYKKTTKKLIPFLY